MVVEVSAEFWDSVDALVSESEIVVDRPAGSTHPRHPEMVYPLDYGYLQSTRGGDGEGIDVWLGASKGTDRAVAALATVDSVKKDMELKLFIDCSPAEIAIVVEFLTSNGMGVLPLIR